MSLKGAALKRAYAKGNRIKIGACCICGKPIYNRMHYEPIGEHGACDYAHQSCSRTQPERNWTRGW